MSILSGYEKYKRHLKVDDENYKLVSEWTHSDTVEMDDGKSLTETITSLKNQTSSFIGNEYSSSSTYKVGDYCVYEGKWYRCIVDITTPETWNPSNWTLTNISDEVTEVQELGQYIRYNQTDDTIQVLNNDKWVDILSGGINKQYISKKKITFDNFCGGFICSENITLSYDEEDNMVFTLSDKNEGYIVANNKINLYKYKNIYMDFNVQTPLSPLEEEDTAFVSDYGRISFTIGTSTSSNDFKDDINGTHNMWGFPRISMLIDGGTTISDINFDGIYKFSTMELPSSYINEGAYHIVIKLKPSIDEEVVPTLTIRELYLTQ